MQIAAWRYADAPDKAKAALDEALQLCQAHGYRRVILDDLDLLKDVFSPGIATGLVLPDWLKHALVQPARAETAQLHEALTKRELHILRQLESSLSNREIAESLFINEGTLKWHLHNIYGKLHARNRSGALLNARKLGLM